MKRYFARLLGLDVDLEAALELMNQYLSMANKARAELAEVKQERDAAVEAWSLEVSRLRDQLDQARETIAGMRAMLPQTD